jgi:transcriptional regulator with XRE-family HTH domain
MAGQLALEPSQFRAEAARYQITRREIGEVIGMHRSEVTKYLNGTQQPTYAWALHNIGYALNIIIGKNIFRVDMKKGVLTVRPGPKRRPQERERYALLPVDLDAPVPSRPRRPRR